MDDEVTSAELDYKTISTEWPGQPMFYLVHLRKTIKPSSFTCRAAKIHGPRNQIKAFKGSSQVKLPSDFFRNYELYMFLIKGT